MLAHKNIKIFHENPLRGSRVLPCRQANGRTDMTELTVTFHNFANIPKHLFSSPNQGYSSRIDGGRNMKLTSRLHLVPRQKHGALPPPPLPRSQNVFKHRNLKVKFKHVHILKRKWRGRSHIGRAPNLPQLCQPVLQLQD
jgi:hypothetical protein